jgi:hypothetical protein
MQINSAHAQEEVDPNQAQIQAQQEQQQQANFASIADEIKLNQIILQNRGEVIQRMINSGNADLARNLERDGVVTPEVLAWAAIDFTSETNKEDHYIFQSIREDYNRNLQIDVIGNILTGAMDPPDDFFGLSPGDFNRLVNDTQIPELVAGLEQLRQHPDDFIVIDGERLTTAEAIERAEQYLESVVYSVSEDIRTALGVDGFYEIPSDILEAYLIATRFADAEIDDLVGSLIDEIFPDGVEVNLDNLVKDYLGVAFDVDITFPGFDFGSAGKYDKGYGPASNNFAFCGASCGGCYKCSVDISRNHIKIQNENSKLFSQHRDWMIDVFFREHLGFAMAAMTKQMTTVGLQATKVIGTFFDAKHQLETQRLFQTLMAEAHKDYQPSEGVCDIATNSRGLAASGRKSDLAHQTLANRAMDRQLLTGDNLAMFPTQNSDLKSRVDTFKKRFCQKTDNAGQLSNICAKTKAEKETINKDVDYTRTVDSVLTMDMDFSKDSALGGPDLTPDEASAFALMANLFANRTMPSIGDRILATTEGIPREAAYTYMNLRSVAAKRSVAQNSISAIMAEKASGDKHIEYAPFLKSAVKELGVEDIKDAQGEVAVSVEEQIDFLVGKNPSYFAQMEVLTKKLYQNPVFFTELYDKPTNVLRKRASIRAIGLMQDRDFYKSLLRTEAVLSVALETMLSKEHDRVYSALDKLEPDKDQAAE